MIDAETLAAHFMCLPPGYYHTSYIVGEITAAPTVHGLDSEKEQTKMTRCVCGALLVYRGRDVCPKCGRKVMWDG